MTNCPYQIIVSCFLSLLIVTGCSSFKNELNGPPGITDTTVEKQESVEKMYARAAKKMDEGSYSNAAKGFDEVEQNYPYSQWATRAQLMAGYSFYKNLKYDDALLSLNRFIELHPGDENISYAYYLRALCYYEQISDVRRDQKMTEMALNGLKQVMERFPDSPYAKDAVLKIDLTMDHLAGKEIEIGRYYLERKQYQAAINRFEKVVEQYQTTTHVPEALHRMTEAYLSLGIINEARKAAAILGRNYPQSRWYKDSYKLVGTPQQKVTQPTDSLHSKTPGKILN